MYNQDMYKPKQRTVFDCVALSFICGQFFSYCSLVKYRYRLHFPLLLLNNMVLVYSTKISEVACSSLSYPGITLRTLVGSWTNVNLILHQRSVASLDHQSVRFYFPNRERFTQLDCLLNLLKTTAFFFSQLASEQQQHYSNFFDFIEVVFQNSSKNFLILLLLMTVLNPNAMFDVCEKHTRNFTI